MKPLRDGNSLDQLRQSLDAGQVSSVDLVERSLLAAEADPLSAFVALAEDRSRAEARALDAELAAGRIRGPLHGIPVAVKDLYDVADEVTTAGSRLPPTGRPAQADAEAVRLLRAAGAVVIGRTRTHEYAWGLITQHESLGGSRNPYDPTRVTGGSSGGSAAAVASGIVPLALGTDTAGSIRLPAAWCGLVGHKPSYGRVSLRGVVPLAPSFDHAGALVRTVGDARVALAVLSGVAVRKAPRRDLADVRIGLPTYPDSPAVDAEIEATVQSAVRTAERAGAQIASVTMPSWPDLLEVFRTVQAIEALAYHRGLGHWPDHADGYGSDVRERLTMADSISSAKAAEMARRLSAIRLEVAAQMADVDVLLQPVTGSAPSAVTAPDVVHVNGTPTDLRGCVLPWTLLASVCGLPACAVPAGFDRSGMPIGLQVIGRWGDDDGVLDVAGLLQPSAL